MKCNDGKTVVVDIETTRSAGPLGRGTAYSDDISLTTSDYALLRRAQEALGSGRVLDINVPGWRGGCHVVRWFHPPGGDGQTDYDSAVIELRPTGSPYDYNKEKEEPVAPKNGKIPRFYVGSKSVFNTHNGTREPWAKHTEAEAIEHATRLVEASPAGDEQYIVKVIKVVRRRPAPIVVEKVS